MLPTRRNLTCLLPASLMVGLASPRLGHAQASGADARTRLIAFQNGVAGNSRAGLAVERTLARLDALEIDFAAPRLILVNIPAAEVIALEGGREVMRSRAVVGAGRTRTPQLLTHFTSVRTNPPWHVPPGLLADIRASGAVGFQAVGTRLIQPPGPTNPLGPLRIGLLNSDGIFLHGTSRPGLFERGARSLSYGCVRVERVHELAAWLLDMPVETLRAAVATGRTTELYPNREAQVVLAYLTAWPDSAGRVVIHPDPYGLDAPGARPARFRRVPRESVDDPLEVEAAARATLAAAGRL